MKEKIKEIHDSAIQRLNTRDQELQMEEALILYDVLTELQQLIKSDDQAQVKPSGNPNGCKCAHCTNHDLYRWATIMECKCSCHDDLYPAGHDALCCPYVNGKRKDNPYTDLKPASYYKKILDGLERDDDLI